MNPFVKVIVGDALQSLTSLEAGTVQTCVTSPPYWGLRDYGTGEWEGGDAECDHTPKVKSRATRPMGALDGGHSTIDASTVQRDCHCGAKRVDAQLGLEPTPEAYVAAMVAVFREVRRVLRDDGTLWLNLGDSYASNPSGQNGTTGTLGGGIPVGGAGMGTGRVDRSGAGCKPKDLVGIPWMVAFALRADGWYLRQDIIWAKPNPMPESVRDRCTKSHEYLFLLSKSPRYYYDASAIAEPVERGFAGSTFTDGKTGIHQLGRASTKKRSGNKERKPASERGVPMDTNGSTNGAVAGSVPWEGDSRNKRSVWTVATEPYPEAHFATFPTSLIRPCVLAGSREGDTVLDPFAGSGTTLEVAQRLGRKAIGIELNPAYAELIRKRIASVPAPMFAGEVTCSE